MVWQLSQYTRGGYLVHHIITRHHFLHNDLERPRYQKLRTRNIKAQCGVANECLVMNKGADIKHLKTDLMIVDILTKPLDYPMFHHFESRMLNHISWEEMIRRVRPRADADEIRKVMGHQAENYQLNGKVSGDNTKGFGKIKSPGDKCAKEGAKSVTWG